MTRLRWLPWLLALLPALTGAAFSLALAQGAEGASIAFVRFKAPLAAWPAAIGTSATAVLVIAGLLWAWTDRRRRRAVQQARATAAAEAAASMARDRRRFLQRLDHELKNPLTAIRAGLALAETNSEPAALASVEAQVRRISRLTADLRKLAELESRPLEYASVDLGKLLGQVFELAQERPEAAERRLTLTLPQAPWPLPAVSGDYDLLVLVAHNLLDNAIKFTRPGDTIEVRAFEAGTWVVVEVADTGPGIPDDEQPHVWEDLYRGASARGVPGSGLGLALTRAIILRHGGDVSLRSRAGQGTVLTARLPFAPPAGVTVPSRRVLRP